MNMQNLQTQDSTPALARFTYSHPGQSKLRRTFIRTVEWASGQPELRSLYVDWTQSKDKPDEDVFSAALRLLGLTLQIKQWRHFSDLPAKGGILLVANHPYGIVDGLSLGHLGLKLRSEVGILTNSLLCRAPEVQPYLLPVDFSGSGAARRLTAETRRRAAELLAAGQCVAVFPAGGVATANRPFLGRAVDADWHPFIGRLATLPNVTTLPVHFCGQNSRLFQLASHLSYPLRVALIFHETRRRRNKPINMILGQPVTSKDLNRLDRTEVVETLRKMTMSLAEPPLPDIDEVFVWPRHLKW